MVVAGPAAVGDLPARDAVTLDLLAARGRFG